ncbi:MAG: GNAT family N-acetyltransferase [Clostridia bacterium]|nr:GNAT family N-acetyltransferase [Clostridia bacterium]
MIEIRKATQGGEGIGGKLIEFAIQNFDVRYLWVLEKNERAVSFYKKHGFHYKNEWRYEEGTTEHLLKMER